jgi:deoxyribonucleoside regulator
MADVDLMVRAAKMSYLQQLNQAEIAEQLGLSRQSVSRLLKQALNDGIVQIEIVTPSQTVSLLEEQLVSRFGLQAAVVVSTVGVPERSIRRQVCRAAASYLTSNLTGSEILGVNWGRTILDVTYQLPKVNYPDIQVVQINGSFTGITPNGGPELVINNVAAALGTTHGVPMNAPMFVDSHAAQQVLLHDSRVAEAIELGRRADVALFTVANASRKSDLYRIGYLKDADIDELERDGAIGEIGGKFFDIRGLPCAKSFAERCLSLELEELRAIPNRICVVVGPEKIQSTSSALHGGLLTVLVLDDTTAKGILELD